MKRRVFLPMIMLLLLMQSCIELQPKQEEPLLVETVHLSEREAYRYNKALAEVEAVVALMQSCRTSKDAKVYEQLLAKSRGLKYVYNSEGMNNLTIEHCEKLKIRIANLKDTVETFVEQNMPKSSLLSLVSQSNKLLEEDNTIAFYLYAGEKIFIEMSSRQAVSLKFSNVDICKTLKSYKTNNINDSLKIEYSGIYTIDMSSSEKCYVSLEVGVRPKTADAVYGRKTVYSEVVECKKEDWGAKRVESIELKKIFDEPRKFTLRGNLKAAFSGNSKALVAVTVPAGATDILYSMRIATSENNRSSDGEFHNNLVNSYKKVKLMGLPVYEKEKSGRSGLISSLLDDNRPLRDGDAYCNMYVFRNQSQAKQFQDETKMASELSYDVDYSVIGSQSCNGRIPVNGLKTIYLAFENERMRYTNYLWVEAEAVVPKTIYYRTKYSAQ